MYIYIANVQKEKVIPSNGGHVRQKHSWCWECSKDWNKTLHRRESDCFLWSPNHGTVSPSTDSSFQNLLQERWHCQLSIKTTHSKPNHNFQFQFPNRISARFARLQPQFSPSKLLNKIKSTSLQSASMTLPENIYNKIYIKLANIPEKNYKQRNSNQNLRL